MEIPDDVNIQLTYFLWKIIDINENKLTHEEIERCFNDFLRYYEDHYNDSVLINSIMIRMMYDFNHARNRN